MKGLYAEKWLTVGQLIERLKQLDPNLLAVHAGEYDNWPVNSVEVKREHISDRYKAPAGYVTLEIKGDDHPGDVAFIS